MAGGKQSLVNSSRGIVFILGLTIVYQVLYHAMMWHAVHDTGSTSDCELGLPRDAPQCIELEIFKTWKAEMDRHPLASLEDSAAPFAMHVDDVNSSDRQLTTMESAPSSSSLGHAVATTSALIVAEPIVTTSWTPMTAWARGLTELQEKLEHRMERLPSVRRKRAQQRWEEFDRLYNDTLKSIRNRSHVTPWALELQAAQGRLQAQMDNLTLSRQRLAARLAALTFATTTEMPLLDRIYQLGRELCEEPHRRGRESCAQFLQARPGSAQATASADGTVNRTRSSPSQAAGELAKRTAAYEAQVAKLKEDHQQWDRLFAKRANDFGRILCADPGRRGYVACRQFIGNGTQADSTTSPAAKFGNEVTTRDVSSIGTSLRGGSKYTQRLQWSTVRAWETAPRRRGIFVVKEDQLRNQKWQGAIPKVGCVTAVVVGPDLRSRLTSFIRNFGRQTYEGPRQLLLVYPHTDTDTGDVVKELADGTYVKAVPARPGNTFPSTSDLRFGSWISDADIIARWDFDEVHHPDRLAMQVRALAVTSRPASILVTEGGVLEQTIVGEAQYMQKHWMPLLAEEFELLNGVQVPYFVQVDVPAVLASDSLHARMEGLLQRFGLDVAEVHTEISSTVCSSSPSSPANKSLDMSVGGQKHGETIGEMYAALKADHVNVGKVLQLLCNASIDEQEPDGRAWLQMKVGQVADIQRKVTTHFNALDTVIHDLHTM